LFALYYELLIIFFYSPGMLPGIFETRKILRAFLIFSRDMPSNKRNALQNKAIFARMIAEDGQTIVYNTGYGKGANALPCG
jgi:hypothetical protein